MGKSISIGQKMVFCLCFLSQNDQILKNLKNFGNFNHFRNVEKISVYGVFNKIVNNFVKKVVKSGQNLLPFNFQINIMYL